MHELEDRPTMTSENRPVSAQAAAQRVLCLAALCYRAHLEAVASCGANPYGTINLERGRKLERSAGGINTWLRRGQLWEFLSGSEQVVLESPVGTSGVQAIIDATWRSEAISVLLWALCITQGVPPYDTRSDLEAELESIPFIRETNSFIRDAELCSPAAMTEAREIAELWHWRARTRGLLSQVAHRACPQAKTLDEVVRKAAARAQNRGLFVAVDGDFPAFGKAYREATVEEAEVLRSIAVERHYALNWLCGMAEDWDHVPTDT
jgi:hypothetical protein